MENPYQAPAAQTCKEDERIIDLLMQYKHQLKVVKMLEKEGLSHNEATETVDENTSEAQRRLNTKHLPWFISAYIFLILTICLIVACIVFDVSGFFPIGFICATLYGSIFSFQHCDVIRP